MKKVLFVVIGLFIGQVFAVTDDGSNVIWTAVFENAMPRNTNISQQYCNSHTPSVIITNIKQITSNGGVKALNGVSIRYISYKGSDIDGLHFNLVKGKVFGIDKNGKAWQEPISLYEQTLSEVAKTWTVWSTPSCKGSFTGYPTILKTN